jgi:CRP/FNR family cyclic AMP-dependent transcriptional regulator
MSATQDMIAEVPLFETMDEQERRALCQLLEVRRVDKGETVFHAGDVGDSFYIVRNGAVQVYIENYEGAKIVLRENNPGDVFGDVSMFDGGPRTATAVATEESELLFLDKEGLLELVKRQPHAALDLLAVMGKRLRTTNELLRTQVSRNLNVEEEDRMSFGERIADKVASFGGSWTFIISFALTMAAYMTLNVALGKRAWDEYPFILLNLMLSTLAALQAPVIMMSQNRQSSKDRLKADLDYEVNLKAELEVAQLHSKVDRIYEEMQVQFDKLQRGAAAK